MSHQHTRDSPRYGVQFHLQSQHITFTEWVALFTICFAPLVAHIIAGVPKRVYLHRERPKWHDNIVLYNPVTIVWRYYTIADRRINARTFTLTDLAATNVLFWTPHGWDGSEEMMRNSQRLCVRSPPKALQRLISTATLKTIIVALQGMSAIDILFNNISGFDDWALDDVFLPLAITGLWRLPAAYWLTEDHAFAQWGDIRHPSSNDPISQIVNESTSQMQLPLLSTSSHSRSDSWSTPLSSTFPITNTGSWSTPLEYNLRRRDTYYPLFRTDSQPRSDIWSEPAELNPRPRNILRAFLSIVLGTFYLSSMLGALALTMYLMWGFPGIYSLTSWWLSRVHALSLLVGAVIVLYYSTIRRSVARSTILPCAGSVWYKAYTCLSIVLFLILIVIAALETRKRRCGPYTTSFGSD